MSKFGRLFFGIGLFALLLPSLLWAQTSTDRSELDSFLKETANQGPPPPIGTKITNANWQQYKAFMPFGMVKLFEGRYQWQMPQDVEIDIGPARYRESAQDLDRGDRKIRRTGPRRGVA